MKEATLKVTIVGKLYVGVKEKRLILLRCLLYPALNAIKVDDDSFMSVDQTSVAIMRDAQGDAAWLLCKEGGKGLKGNGTSAS